MRLENPAIWRPPPSQTIICPQETSHDHADDTQLDDMQTMLEDIHTITTTKAP